MSLPRRHLLAVAACAAISVLMLRHQPAWSRDEAHTPPPKPGNLLVEQPRLTAGSLDFDGRNNFLTLTEVRITTQSGYVIQAGAAQTSDANNFNNSRWAFKDKVEITTPQGRTTSDTANVSFVQNQVSELHMIGAPATFEQYDAAKQVIARGHAGAIDYDLKQNTVRLSNDAWIKYGQNECRAVTLSYNIAAQRVSARTEEQQGQRVNCTLSPNTGASASSSASQSSDTSAGNTTP